jgi:hypothetical protein
MELNIKLHIFSTSAQDSGGYIKFTPKKKATSTHLTEGWIGPQSM